MYVWVVGGGVSVHAVEVPVPTCYCWLLLAGHATGGHVYSYLPARRRGRNEPEESDDEGVDREATFEPGACHACACVCVGGVGWWWWWGARCLCACVCVVGVGEQGPARVTACTACKSAPQRAPCKASAPCLHRAGLLVREKLASAANCCPGACHSLLLLRCAGTRLHQILQWLQGGDAAGSEAGDAVMIVFDEGHKAKNLMAK